MVTVVVMY